MGSYIPVAKQTNKSTITVKDLLLHQAGLTPYIPFFLNLKLGEYSRDSSFFHPLKVADNYYLRPNYFEEVMYPRMLNTAVQPKGRYNYSDLSMYFLKDIVERQAMERLDKYVEKQFYAPLGMQTAGFNPRQRLDRNRIVPTEQDNSFRKTLLEGYVHDPGAAMAGGISGHAGLFSSANDMAILFQMFLNGGTYGGQQYFKKETIDLFTAKYSNVSRRGLGFDRWDPDRTNRYPSDLASPKSYGHTGYTGTCVWVDPEYNLIYIFLSNRVHPSVTNKLSTLRIRPRIQDVIYTAIRKAERNR
jgi:CubicO group peptidase (beta-lactamase class C family)